MQQEQERMVSETLVDESTQRSSFSPKKLFMAKLKDKIKARKEETKGKGHLDQQFYPEIFFENKFSNEFEESESRSYNTHTSLTQLKKKLNNLLRLALLK
ncbi:unnamed protein product [Rhizopus microsporus]